MCCGASNNEKVVTQKDATKPNGSKNNIHKTLLKHFKCELLFTTDSHEQLKTTKLK